MRYANNVKVTDRLPHALYIIDLTSALRIFENAKDCFAENNISDPEQIASCIDWVILDIVNDVLASKRMRLSGHYRFDEGKIVKDALMSSEIEAIHTTLASRMHSIRDGKVTAMMSGSTVVISKEILE